MGGVANPNLEERGGRRGSGMVPFERALVTSYGLSILHSNFSSIFTRFRDIAAFVLQHATLTHPTSSLKIFPCSPRSRWMAFWLRRANLRRCWANCPSNWFPRFPTYVITIHQRHGQTDGQTDRQTTSDGNTVLCTIVHRAVKTIPFGTWRPQAWVRGNAPRKDNNNSIFLRVKCTATVKKNKKDELSQRCSLWVPENFREFLTTPAATFRKRNL